MKARDLPAGLLCRYLNDHGYTYADSVEYWYAQGSPGWMDVDSNGIPCETVYPASDVAAYYGQTPVGPSFLPAGLLCRDLLSRNLTYADAVVYWYFESAPSRMDIDNNGIPCETVYPQSAIANYFGYWYTP